MIKIDPAVYLNSSNQDDEVIVFGKSPEQEAEDHRNGVARLGGDWRRPNYAKAYLRAARVLIGEAQENKDLDQLGLPIFYLQRHTVELFIKELLRLLYDVAKMQFDLHQSVQTEANLPSENEIERLNRRHGLRELNDDLRDASTRLQIAGYPKELQLLVNDIEQYESDNPTWPRYPHSGKASINIHLKTEVAIPLVDLHQRLEILFQEAALDVDQEAETFETSIYHEWNSLVQLLEHKSLVTKA